MVVVGGGPIGCELGQGFARLGTKVTMIQKGQRILSNDDAFASEFLHQQMTDDGVNIELNSHPSKLE